MPARVSRLRGRASSDCNERAPHTLNARTIREKKILEPLSRPQFFPGFEISRSLLRAKQVEKRAGNFKTRKIVVLKVVLIFFSPLVTDLVSEHQEYV